MKTQSVCMSGQNVMEENITEGIDGQRRYHPVYIIFTCTRDWFYFFCNTSILRFCHRNSRTRIYTYLPTAITLVRDRKSDKFFAYCTDVVYFINIYFILFSRRRRHTYFRLYILCCSLLVEPSLFSGVVGY